MNIKDFTFLFAALISLLAVLGKTQANVWDDPIKESGSMNRDDLEFHVFWEAVLNERQKLKSWHFEAVCIEKQQSRGASEAFPESAGEKRREIEFWKDGDAFRFECKSDGAKAVTAIKNADGYFVSTWNSDVLAVDEREALRHMDFLDVRAAGLGLWVEIAHQSTLEQLVRRFQDTKFPHTLRTLNAENAIVKIGPYSPDGNTYFEMRFQDPGAKVLHAGLTENDKESMWVDVQWTKVSGCFVPEKLVLAVSNATASTEKTIEFRWKSANTSIPTEVFDVARANPAASFILRDVNGKTEATRIQRVVEPPFFRRTSFYALVAIPFVAVAWLLYARSRKR